MKKNTHGFTLAETLLAVTLLGIVFLAVGGGMAAFQRAYTGIKMKADAQSEILTVSDAMTSDFKNATIYYRSSNAIATNTRDTAIYYENTDSGITVMPYLSSSATGSALVNENSLNASLIVSCDPIQYSDSGMLSTTIYIKSRATDIVVKQEIVVVKPLSTIAEK